eukprot:g81084.t1
MKALLLPHPSSTLTMPELPELRLASQFVNEVCRGRLFHAVSKSEVSKSPEILLGPSWRYFKISSLSRGKEMALILENMDLRGKGTDSNDHNEAASPAADSRRSSDSKLLLLFHFGMSGRFTFGPLKDRHKHAHLSFSTDCPGLGEHILSFVDVRRFGGWKIAQGFDEETRGPCPLLEYAAFRSHVLTNLEARAFDKPICEVMLNQTYFNGIGNYLRAEALFKAGIRPFDQAREVLSPLREAPESEPPQQDLLWLCRELSQQVVKMGGTGYSGNEEDDVEFTDWLQCYQKADNLLDHNKRTIWFFGQPGRLVPKQRKSVKPTMAQATDALGKSRPQSSDSETKGKKKGKKKDKKKEEKKEEKEKAVDPSGAAGPVMLASASLIWEKMPGKKEQRNKRKLKDAGEEAKAETGEEAKAEKKDGSNTELEGNTTAARKGKAATRTRKKGVNTARAIDLRTAQASKNRVKRPAEDIQTEAVGRPNKRRTRKTAQKQVKGEIKQPEEQIGGEALCKEGRTPDKACDGSNQRNNNTHKALKSRGSALGLGTSLYRIHPRQSLPRRAKTSFIVNDYENVQPEPPLPACNRTIFLHLNAGLPATQTGIQKMSVLHLWNVYVAANDTTTTTREVEGLGHVNTRACAPSIRDSSLMRTLQRLLPTLRIPMHFMVLVIFHPPHLRCCLSCKALVMPPC